MIKKVAPTLALALVLSSSQAWAQAAGRFEITPFYGWQFGGGVAVIGGDLEIKDAAVYGVILDVTMRPGTQLELSYSRQETELQSNPFGLPRETLFDMTVEYWQIGGLGFTQRGGARPFGSFTLGATHYNPDSVTLDGEWRFSMVLGGGVKIIPSERLGIRLQGHLLTTFLSTGSGIWCGGGGCSFGLFGSGILKGEVSAGVILALGN